jgi:nitrate/nitrite transporter NarK
MRRLTANPWLVCLSAASFFFYQYIQITSFNVLKPELMRVFNTSAASLSLIGAFYFYGTVLFLVPAGIMLDYLSTRLIILLAICLSLFGLFLFTTAESLIVAAIGRFLVGISGGPFCFLGTMRLAARWFPEDRFAFVTGVIVALGMLGGIVAQMPLIALIQAVGLKNAMYVNLGLGAMIALIIYLYVYDYPPGKENEYKKQLAYYREIGFIKGLKTVILKKQNWYCGFFASLLNLPIFVFGALLGIIYLTQNFALTPINASVICSFLFLGMLIGAPTFGLFSDRLHLRKIPMLIGLVMCLVAVVILIQANTLAFSSLCMLFFIIGFGSSSQVLAYPTVTESNPAALTGSALSLASVIIMAGGAIFQPLIGALLEIHWNGAQVGGMALYSSSDYRFALWMLPICIGIAAAMAFLIRETYCRRAARC